MLSCKKWIEKNSVQNHCIFRLEIEDICSDKNPENRKPETKIVSKPAAKDDCDDELRKLIIPKKIVRSKLSQAVSNMKKLCSEPKPQKMVKWNN